MKELEAAFAINQYPSAAERDQLAAKIGVTESRIQVTGALIMEKVECLWSTYVNCTTSF